MRTILRAAAVAALATGGLLTATLPAAANVSPPTGYYDVTVDGNYVGQLHIYHNQGEPANRATFSGNGADGVGAGSEYIFYSGGGISNDHRARWSFQSSDGNGNYSVATYFCDSNNGNCTYNGNNNSHYTGG